MLLANSVQCDWLYRGSPLNLGNGGGDGSWTAGGGFPVISRNGTGAPGKEVRLSRGSEVLGMTFLGAVTVQAPGLFSDPAEQGWVPNMQSDPVSLTFHTAAKPDSSRSEFPLTLTSTSPPAQSPLWLPICGPSKEKPKWLLWPMRPWPCCLLPTPGTTHPRAFALAVDSFSFHQLNSIRSQPKSFFVPEASSDPVSVEAT